MSKKTYSASELTALEQKHALPAGWLTALLALAQKVAPVLYDFVIGLLSNPPVAKTAKAACPEDCCCVACTQAAQGIIAMHSGDYEAAGQAFILAAVHAATASGCCAKP